MIKENEEIRVDKVSYAIASLFFTVTIHLILFLGIAFAGLAEYIPAWVHLAFFTILFVYFFVSSIRYEEKLFRYKPEEEYLKEDNQEW